MQLDTAIDVLLRGAFLLLYGSALFHKLSDFGKFRATVATYVKDSPLSRFDLPFAVCAILLETCAILACLNIIKGVAGVELIADVLLLYAFAMWLNLRRGNVLLDCGCSWGSARHPVGYGLVVRNIVLACIAGILILPGNGRPLEILDWIAIASGLVLMVLIYSIMSRISMNTAAINGIK